MYCDRAAPNRLSVVAERHTWVRMAGELRHKPNFDPLRL